MPSWLQNIQQWQTLIGAGVAIIAVWIAWKNATRQIHHAAELETKRRARKIAALRAVLPLALNSLTEYGGQSIRSLRALHRQGVRETIPLGAEVLPVPEVPAETVKSLAEFIEYSDDLDVRVVERTLARIQVHAARWRDLKADLKGQREGSVITQAQVEDLIIHAATIYAGSAAVFDYARQQTNVLPTTISWDDVRAALRSVQLWDNDIPKIWATIDRMAEHSLGPSEPGQRP